MGEITILSRKELQPVARDFGDGLQEHLSLDAIVFNTIGLLDRVITSDEDQAQKIERMTQIRLQRIYDDYSSGKFLGGLTRDRSSTAYDELRGMALILKVKGDEHAAETILRLVNNARLGGLIARKERMREEKLRLVLWVKALFDNLLRADSHAFQLP